MADSHSIALPPSNKSPQHVAIIMDGNGRWAQLRGKARIIGHHRGAIVLKKIVKNCPKLGIKFLTLFAFSTENWKRTQSEVSGLMSLFRSYIIKEANTMKKAGIRVRFIGDRYRLDQKLVQLMNDLEAATSDNDVLHLTIALNYGSRDEFARATKRLVNEVLAENINPRDIDEQTLPRFLDTYFLPDPDLVIRTSGEARISNFLLWQSAYAEYEFIDTLWPDFTPHEFDRVIQRFGDRKRRFGVA